MCCRVGEGGTGCGGDKEGPGLLTDDLRPEVKEICEGPEGRGKGEKEGIPKDGTAGAQAQGPNWGVG